MVGSGSRLRNRHRPQMARTSASSTGDQSSAEPPWISVVTMTTTSTAAKKDRNPMRMSRFSARRAARRPEVAIRAALLHAAGGQTGDDLALEDQDHDDQRDRDDRAGGHDRRIRFLVR